jgi:hypothetical protein
MMCLLGDWCDRSALSQAIISYTMVEQAIAQSQTAGRSQALKVFRKTVREALGLSPTNG